MKKGYVLAACIVMSSIFLSSCSSGPATSSDKTPNIILSSNNIELSVNESKQLTYTTIPESVSEHVRWEVIDSSIASVDESGIVTGISEGETNIIISLENGECDTCSVVVVEMSAYDQLDQNGRDLVDKICSSIDMFYDPGSVSVSYAYLSANGSWDITIRARNQLGGYSEQDYNVSSDGSINTPILNHVKIESIENLDLVNEAIKDFVNNGR